MARFPEREMLAVFMCAFVMISWFFAFVSIVLSVCTYMFLTLQVQAKLLENMISQNNELLTKVKERCCGGCQCQGAGSILGAGFIHDQLPSREPKEEAKEEAQRLFEAG